MGEKDPPVLTTEELSDKQKQKGFEKWQQENIDMGLAKLAKKPKRTLDDLLAMPKPPPETSLSTEK